MSKNTHRAAAFLASLLLGSAMLRAQTSFTKYVALGDSITASFQGLCLVTRNQNGSYPMLLSEQLGITGFQQPLFGEGPLTSSDANKCLGFVVNGDTIGVGPVSDQLLPTNSTLPRPYDNLGIPGASVGDLLYLTSPDPTSTTNSTVNKFGYAILRNNLPGNPFQLNGTSAVQQATSLNPDLVTLWAGSDDVLGALLYALALDGVTMTPVDFFTQTYTQIVQSMTANGATIVTLNIPPVEAVPFANTIPPVVVDPSTGQPLLVNGQTVPLLGPGDDAFPCPASACPLPAGTLVTLAANSPQQALGGQSLLGLGFGIPCQVAPTLPQCGKPLPVGHYFPPPGPGIVPGAVLYPDVVNLIQTRTVQLNDVIASVTAAAGGIPVDVYGLFSVIAETGYRVGGITLTTQFATGGIFSADGFHPNLVGQALVADEIVKALNAARNLSIPQPDLFAVLFTPDVPPTSSAATVSGFQYSAELLQQLYAVFPPLTQGIAGPRVPILLPNPRTDRPPTRNLDRPAADHSR